MHYNSLNQLTWDSISQYLTGAWAPQGSDSFGYTTGLDYSTYEKSLNCIDGSPASFIIRTKHINSINLPDTLYQMEYYYADSTFISGAKYSYTYDSYDEPVLALQYTFNIDTTLTSGTYSTTPDYINHYYYELYYERGNVNSVKNTPTAAEDLKIYPNPATSTVNISRPDAARGAYTIIKIVNATGQTVHSESMPWLNETETIYIAGLTPGMYWIMVQDKAGNNLCRQSLIKE